MVWNLTVFIMHISALQCTEELQHTILRTLKDMGVKHRLKKLNVNKYSQLRATGNDGRLFKKPLHQLQCQKITLESGCEAEVPTFIIEACKCIEENSGTEGLFRKAGSNARQRQIKTHLDSGGKLGRQHHVIDVANVLKHFFRELPEPLLPYIYHDLFMRCLLLKEMKVEAVLLTCLLLPAVHLASLEYIMQFFQRVASQSELNKMDTRNLAIILTPSIMPVDEKMITNTGTRLGYHVSIVETLLENASEIGLLPDHIYCQLTSVSHDGIEMLGMNGEEGPKTKKKKKRRSNSFTRVINGFKKMVGRISPDVDENDLISSTPDFSTPVMKSTKKRKLLDVPTSAFSNKKRQEVLKSLPQGVPLSSVQFTPTPTSAHYVSRELYLTPQVCVHPNPTTKSRSPVNKPRNRKLFPQKIQDNRSGNETCPDQICMASTNRKKPHSLSNQVREETSWLQKHTASLERRWSTGLWRRKRRLDSLDVSVPSESTDMPDLSTSSGDLVFSDAIVNLSDCDLNEAIVDGKLSRAALEDYDNTASDSVEFVRIPKSEYEAIKNRVSEIENQITREFGNVNHASSDEQVCGTLSVQSAYERTLEEQARLDGTPGQDMVSADQLARRLSRELRIRRSLDGARPIRSPSARKIGSLRRRSREIEAQKLRRNSWASPDAIVSTANGSALRRGRPNTVLTGLRRPCRRSSSYHGRESNIDTDATSSVSKNCAAGNDTFGNLACTVSPVLSDQQLFLQRGKSIESSVGMMTVSSTPQFAEQNHCVVTHQPMLEGSEDFAAVSNGDQWFSAETHLPKTPTVHGEAPVTGRASVARIRNENAGMVLERMRLFDNYIGDAISGVLDTPVPISNRTRINCLKGVDVINGQQHSKIITVHRTTKNITHGTTTSNKKKCHAKSPKETSRKTRHKQSKSPLSKSAILSSHVNSPKNRLVRKSHSCKVAKSQHSHSRFNKTTPSKTANGEKENLAATDDQFFRNKIAEFRSQKCQDILRKQSHLDSSKDVSSPLKVRNRVDVANVVAGRNNIEVKYQTPVPHIKDSLLLRSPSKMLKPYMNSGSAAGRHPITPIKAMTPLHSTPARRSPRLTQSCL
ncbi:uncharacterized protein LOC126259817 isoform X1 [Schistocerca nitens]|uniref:uncharacterized protein LOC126259817 isoform X1 n=2 Tax=Schistocerca nitens TaxID=7011 RepID=UPI00211953B9|nr:uncharacterized protein LOC126259817 isoform X1 [Schistocerca nitens]